MNARDGEETRRPRLRRGVGTAAVAGLVVAAGLAGGVAAGLAVTGSGEGSVGGVREEALEPELSGAPWLFQPDGAPLIADVSPRPSLRFPPDVSYAKALEELYRASLEDGRLPEGTTTEEPLPAAVVLVEPVRAGEGLRLSLTAPWGYDDAGRIRVPSLHLPGEWGPERVSEALRIAHAEGRAIPTGAGVDGPRLSRCQVALGTPEEAPSC